MQQWVRARAKQGGFPRLSALHLVSSVRGTGVAALLQDLRAAAGAKGDVWVIGAQVRWALDISLVGKGPASGGKGAKGDIYVMGAQVH